MNLTRLMLLICVSIPFKSFSVELSNYCESGRTCYSGFMIAIEDSILKSEPLVFDLEAVTIPELHLIGNEYRGLELIGVGDVRPIVYTNKFIFEGVDKLTIDGLDIRGIDYQEGSEEQDGSLILIKGFNYIKVEGVVFINNILANSAENLLSIFETFDIKISNNTFRGAGLAMRIESNSAPNDPRPKGSGVTFLNVDNLVLSNNSILEVKKNGIYFASNTSSSDHYISRNYINLKNYSLPTERYGLLGATGIYYDQSAKFANITLVNNQIKNFKQSASRINGENFNVYGNYINTNYRLCNSTGLIDNQETPTGDAGIKSHYLKNSIISNNCISKTLAGVQLESWDVISNIAITSNTIVNNKSSIVVEDLGKGEYSEIRISDNTVLGSALHALTLRPSKIIRNTVISGNTFSNGNPDTLTRYYPETILGGALVIIKNQADLYFGNNWLEGQAKSINWTHLDIHNVTNSQFVNSYIKSPNSKDLDFGGITIRVDVIDNIFNALTLDGLMPGIHDFGVNEFNNITHK